jgi:hypothetical protein
VLNPDPLRRDAEVSAAKDTQRFPPRSVIHLAAYRVRNLAGKKADVGVGQRRRPLLPKTVTVTPLEAIPFATTTS